MADKKKPSKLESGVRGAAEMGSLGFADELEGAVMAAKDGYDAGSFSKLKEMMGPRINQARQQYAAAKAENPKSYMVGQGVGMAGSMLIPGGALAQGTIKGAALAGGAMGAAAGLGGANIKDFSQDELLRGGKDAAMGAGLGAAGGAAMTKVAPRFEKLMAEMKPRRNLPGSAPQQTLEQMASKLSPEDAQALNLNTYQYAPEISELERMAGRRAVNQQLPPEAPKMNVPSDTVALPAMDELTQKLKLGMR